MKYIKMNMTRFSFVICLMAISTACLQAVVLPKTSYVDMPIEGVYDDYGFSAGSYVYSASPFYALGSYETCTSELPNIGACEDCCDSSFDPYNNPDFIACATACNGDESCIAECENTHGAAEVAKCKVACNKGESLPLDGGEWLLVFALMVEFCYLCIGKLSIKRYFIHERYS